MEQKMHDYKPTPLKGSLSVTHLISAHYFEYPKDFGFTGEAHNFWEFLYVDKGQVIVDAGPKRHTLTQGQLILHAPNEWHTVFSDGKIAPNLIVMSFSAQGSALEQLEGLIVHANPEIKGILSQLIEESSHAFTDDLSDYRLTTLTPSEHAPYASGQMLKLLMEQLLIHLIRMQEHPSSINQMTAIQLSDQSLQLERISQAIRAQLHEKITLDGLARETSLSVSTIARCIKKSHHMSVMHFVEEQKVAYVKDRMREGLYHFDELAHRVGYLSVSHLGRVFKKHMGMTLSDYLRRLKR